MPSQRRFNIFKRLSSSRSHSVGVDLLDAVQKSGFDKENLAPSNHSTAASSKWRSKHLRRSVTRIFSGVDNCDHLRQQQSSLENDKVFKPIIDEVNETEEKSVQTLVSVRERKRVSEMSKEEVFDMLTCNEASHEYWAQMAEQRRIALEKTLEENERLHMIIDQLYIEVQELRNILDDAVKLINRMGSK
ncbi:hypothetical protein ACOME3_006183 [Neoechinorhynchus agilis]